MPESQSWVLESLWPDFMKGIAALLPEQSFRTWIQPIRPERLDGNILILHVPTQFHLEWIESHYAEQIRQLLAKLTGRELTLSFIVEPKPGGCPEREPSTLPPRVRPRTIHAPVPDDSELNPRYVFDNFVEGDGNSFARAACLAIAEAPGKTPWNPLLIYGDTGLGKTHLLQAIGNFASAHKKVRRVRYVSSEKYTHEFIHSVKNNRSTDFSKLYRSAELLLVDDIQFFAAKERTQVEFFHTFNSLYQAGKQIVLSSDRPVHELDGIDSRLISRFQSGLITQISPLDFETRVAILERRGEEEGIPLPPEIAQFLATHITNNIRELEGALVTLLARATFFNTDATLELAQDVLREKTGRSVTKPPIERIQELVAQHFGLAVEALRGKSRKHEIALARMLAMALCTHLTNHSLKHIGHLFGGRDHSTVIHARNTILRLKEEDTFIKESYATLLRQLDQSTPSSTSR